jgi:hypothetical protein
MANDASSRLEDSPARRRWADTARQKSVWVLVAGALLQGGFLTMSWRLLAIGERQLDRERALLVQQHNEMLARVDGMVEKVESLSAQAGELQAIAGTVRGMAMGRLKCPDLVCPPPRACPACPSPIIVTNPGVIGPPVPPAPPAPPAPSRLQRREP